MNTLSTPRLSDNLERQARKRAGARMGWYLHAAVYLVVNLGLTALSFASGHHWAVFPAMGWGLGLAIHGAAVWLAINGGGLRERLVQQERDRLSAEARSPR